MNQFGSGFELRMQSIGRSIRDWYQNTADSITRSFGYSRRRSDPWFESRDFAILGDNFDCRGVRSGFVRCTSNGFVFMVDEDQPDENGKFPRTISMRINLQDILVIKQQPLDDLKMTIWLKNGLQYQFGFVTANHQARCLRFCIRHNLLYRKLTGSFWKSPCQEKILWKYYPVKIVND